MLLDFNLEGDGDGFLYEFMDGLDVIGLFGDALVLVEKISLPRCCCCWGRIGLLMGLLTGLLISSSFISGILPFPLGNSVSLHILARKRCSSISCL